MLELVCGRSGRGKTQYIFDKIKEVLKQQTNERVYLIVPDQMSFQTEYALLQQVQKQSMLRVEVLGISRFVTQMISHLNGTNYTVFDSLAQKILLLESSMSCKDNLAVYQNVVDKPEFISYLQQFSRALKGGGMVFNEALPYRDFETKHPLLFKKMQETDLIFSYYQKHLEPLVFDSADKMRHYLSLLRQPENQEKLQQIQLYIDGFYTFNKLEAEVLSQTLQYVNEGSMTFAFDVRDHVKSNSIFSLIQKQFKYFSEKLPSASIVRIDIMNHRFKDTPLLSFVERHYEQPQRLELPEGTVSPIDVTVYETIEQEISGIAQNIRQKIISEGVRAKEIAVYVPDKDLYAPLIEKYFPLYGIPYYLDLKDSMLIHPIFNWLFSLLQIVKRNWQMEDILHLLQNEFFRFQHNISTDDYYLFVDFVNQMKYPYKYIWESDKYWLYYDRPERLEDSLNNEKTARIQRIKAILIDDINLFSEILKQQDVTTDIVLRTLFTYIQEQDVYQYVAAHESGKEDAKYLSHVTETQYQEAVWKQLIYLFEQLHIALGAMPYQKETVIMSLLLGLEEAEFTSVPQSFDSVMIGDFARTKFQTLYQDKETSMGVQYGYILGVSDKFVPHQDTSINMLSAEELTIMQNQGMLSDMLLQDELMNYQLFHFYTLVTSAAKEVHLSYYQYSGIYLEEEQFSSAVLKPLIDGFGAPVRYETADVQASNLANMSMQAAKQMLLREYTRHATNGSDLWKVLEVSDSAFIKSLAKVAKFKNDVQFNRKMNLPETFSVTQVETYNRCSYQYFLKYILKIRAPYEEKMQPFQTGVLLHGAYEWLAEKAQKEGIKVSDVKYVNKLINRYFVSVEQNLATHPLFNVLANKYIYTQTQKIVEQSLPFILKNEARGSFIPQYIEYQLPTELIALTHTRAKLIGKLDRIDFDTKGEYLRIIDYKSSQQVFDFNALLQGTQLQLPVYSYLTSQAFKEKFAGSLYVPLVENYILVDTPQLAQADILAKMEKTYRATGFVIDDPASLVLFDNELHEQTKSSVISYARNNNGQASAHAMVLKDKESRNIQHYAMQKVKKTLDSIVDQQFPVRPMRENFDQNRTACARCAFKSICQFDKTINRYNEQEQQIREASFVKKKEKFLDIIMESKRRHDA